jgi:hypothetical protein
MNEDLELLDEYEAVRRLIEKTGAEFVFRHTTVCPAVELLPILATEHDRRQRYLLDNGPTEDEPGVYVINDEGEIHPDRCYSPVDPGSYLDSALGMFGSSYQALAPMKRHVDFD